MLSLVPYLVRSLHCITAFSGFQDGIRGVLVVSILDWLSRKMQIATFEVLLSGVWSDRNNFYRSHVVLVGTRTLARHNDYCYIFVRWDFDFSSTQRLLFCLCSRGLGLKLGAAISVLSSFAPGCGRRIEKGLSRIEVTWGKLFSSFRSLMVESTVATFALLASRFELWNFQFPMSRPIAGG